MAPAYKCSGRPVKVARRPWPGGCISVDQRSIVACIEVGPCCPSASGRWRVLRVRTSPDLGSDSRMASSATCRLQDHQRYPPAGLRLVALVVGPQRSHDRPEPPSLGGGGDTCRGGKAVRADLDLDVWLRPQVEEPAGRRIASALGADDDQPVTRRHRHGCESTWWDRSSRATSALIS